jgi:nicotinamide riboside kinase
MEKSTTRIYKIAIVGPESTGKSSLAQALAMHFNEPWVPEIARDYITNLDRPYTLNDITLLAELQLQAEQEKINSAKKFLFCDTTLLVNKIWAQFVFNEVPQIINELYLPQDYVLHLLCDIDLPWEYDPLREHPNYRKELFQLYEKDLELSQANYIKVNGFSQQRIDMAVDLIHQLILSKINLK